jgi:hypothetical protein
MEDEYGLSTSYTFMKTESQTMLNYLIKGAGVIIME